jgi:hypothetical protein
MATRPKLARLSLARVQARSAEAAAFDRVLEHGSTRPKNLARRRSQLTAACQHMKTQRENVIEALDAERAAHVARVRDIKSIRDTDIRREKHRAEMQQFSTLTIALQQYRDQLIFQQSMLEAQCLQIDSSTIRCIVKDRKTGAIKGIKNFTSAAYLEEISQATLELSAVARMLMLRGMNEQDAAQFESTVDGEVDKSVLASDYTLETDDDDDEIVTLSELAQEERREFGATKLKEADDGDDADNA